MITLIIFLGVISTPVSALSYDLTEDSDMTQETLIQSEKTWRVAGPGGGGATLDPMINPYDDNTILLYSDMSSMYLTKDGGNQFKMLNFDSYMTAQHFADENTIYVGGNALYRSSNKGEDFEMLYPKKENITRIFTTGYIGNVRYETNVGYPTYDPIQYVTTHPLYKAHIYIIFNNGSKGRLFASTNDGESFVEVMAFNTQALNKYFPDQNNPEEGFLFTDTEVLKINIKTKEKRVLQTGKFTDVDMQYDEEKGKHIFYLVKDIKAREMINALFISEDELESISEISNNLSFVKDTSFTYYINFVRVANDEKVYISIANQGIATSKSDYGLASSDDNGTTWAWKEIHPLKITLDNPGWVEDVAMGGAYCKGFTISKTNSDFIVVTNLTQVLISENGGESFRQVQSKVRSGTNASTGIDVLNVEDILVDPFDDQHLMMPVVDMSLFHSYDRGQTWVRSNNTNLPYYWRGNCYSAVFDEKQPGLVWSVWSSLHDLPSQHISDTTLNKAVGGVAISTDSGNTWHMSNNGLPENLIPMSIIVTDIGDDENRILYITTYGKGIYKSIDSGKSWTSFNDGISADNLYTCTINKGIGDDLYLVIPKSFNKNGEIYKCTDGVNWEKMNLPAHVNSPMSLDYDNEGNLYLGAFTNNVVDGYHYKSGGVYKSTDGGSAWINIFDETKNVYGIMVDKATNQVYVSGFFSSIYMIEQDAVTEFDGFRFTKGKNILKHNGTLYVTTFGGSLWIYE